MTPEEFTAVTAHVEYQRRGAFFSELYLFVSLCVERGVTRIIESGVHHGVSTRVFRAIWPGRVSSIEFRPERVDADIAADLVIGDGVVLVPQLVKQYRTDLVGVFLDGPKGVRAKELREWCLTQPHVKVVAQHDSPIGSGELQHSYAPAFQRYLGPLDARIDPAIRACYAHGCPGMGVWVAA